MLRNSKGLNCWFQDLAFCHLLGGSWRPWCTRGSLLSPVGPTWAALWDTQSEQKFAPIILGTAWAQIESNLCFSGLLFRASGPRLCRIWMPFSASGWPLPCSSWQHGYPSASSEGGSAQCMAVIASGCHSDASRHHFESSWTWLATRMLDDSGMLSAGTVVSLQLDCSNYVHPSP